MNSTKELLLMFKEISNDIYKALENADIEQARKLSTTRQDILEKIKNTEIDRSIDLEKEYSIYSINNKINSKIDDLKVLVKNEMKLVNNERNANNAYGKQFKDIFFVNKII